MDIDELKKIKIKISKLTDDFLYDLIDLNKELIDKGIIVKLILDSVVEDLCSYDKQIKQRINNEIMGKILGI